MKIMKEKLRELTSYFKSWICNPICKVHVLDVGMGLLLAFAGSVCNTIFQHFHRPGWQTFPSFRQKIVKP